MQERPAEFETKVSPMIKQVKVLSMNFFQQANTYSVAEVVFEYRNRNNLFKKREHPSFAFRVLEEPSGSHRIQIRLFDVNTKRNIPPFSVSHITINKISYETKKYFVRPKMIKGIDNLEIYNNIDVTDLLKEGRNVISFVTKEVVHNTFVSVVEIESISLLDTVKRVSENSLKSNEMVSLDLNANNDGSEVEEDEFEEEQQTIPLKCPITKTKMKIPVRGVNCTHVSCFDLENFIRNSTIKQSFNCPICYKPLPVSEIVVDRKVQELLKKTADDVETFTLGVDGTISDVKTLRWESEGMEKETDEEEMRYMKKNAKPDKTFIATPSPNSYLSEVMRKMRKIKDETKPKKEQQPKRHFSPNTLLELASEDNSPSPMTALEEWNRPPEGVVLGKKKSIKKVHRTKTPELGLLVKGTKDDPIEL
ncbi:sumo ligase, putative [Entamoeba invadens IP1]|uniref:sumo ligase, putative n=1 Tax=Entamoeba invadens IP1 TaxID=370355 RepID=UPI0002C3E14C|nr:sumo ligase, putative [Entamoeba invadens IP1]ELP90587.1 sumo ligase, putative [Entamoeba invadens IP1]|eukprot:XP_004257358.1 sumo ligase, putative [Entamoeba invadens IP1]